MFSSSQIMCVWCSRWWLSSWQNFSHDPNLSHLRGPELQKNEVISSFHTILCNLNGFAGKMRQNPGTLRFSRKNCGMSRFACNAHWVCRKNVTSQIDGVAFFQSRAVLSISITDLTSRTTCSRSQPSGVNLRVDFAVLHLELSSKLDSRQPELTDTARELSSNLLF